MRRDAPWLLLIFLLPLLMAPTASSVWDANEAFYTQTPREMVQRGDWLVPHFNDRPRLNKPPLSYWLVAVLYEIFGVSLACERWLLVLLGMLSVGMTYGIALRLRDSTTALLAAGIFATNFRFLVLSRRLLIDILLLTCLLAAFLFFLWWRESRRPALLRLTGAALGLGFLAKGPVAGLGLLVILLFSVWEDRGRALRRGPWLAALLIMAGLATSWHLALAWREGWQPVLDFYWRENLGRFSSFDYGPTRGPFYYFGVLLGDFLPWSLLFAAAIPWKARRWRQSPEGERAGDVLVLIWVALWFVLFSLSRNKQEYYILPLYPAAAVWAADFARRVKSSRWLGAAGGAVVTAAGLGLALMAQELFRPSWVWWIPAAAAAAFAWLGWKRRWHAAAGALSVMYAALFLLYLPPLEQYRPMKGIAETVSPLVHDSPAQAGTLNLAAPSLRFYLDEPIVELFDIREAAAQLDAGRPLYLVMVGGDWPALQQTSRTRLTLVEERRRLVVNLRSVFEALLRWGDPSHSPWTYPVYLATNQTAGGSAAP